MEHVRYTGVGAQPFDGNPLNVDKAAADHLTVGFVKVRDTSHTVADQDALLYGLENGVYFHEFHYNTFGQGGVGACLASAEEEGVQNLRVMCHDAVEVLHTMIPDNSLNMVQLFFPDPWHKARHNKRRIVQPPFAELVKSKLKLGGVFHMATDWEAYAEHMLEVMSSLEGYRNRSESNDYVPRPESRPVTKFEQRGHRLGHGVWDLMFERVK